MAFNRLIKEIELTIFGPLCYAVMDHVAKAINEGRTVYPREGEEFYDKIMMQASQRLMNLQPINEIDARIDELKKLKNYLKADTERALKEHNIKVFPEGTYPYKTEIEQRIIDLEVIRSSLMPKESKV